VKPRPAFLLRANGTEYHIFVEESAEAAPNQALPAILFMDGDDQFRFAVEAYRSLRDRKAIPPLLLVGVGYGASYARPANKRMRDYTPTAMPGEPGTGEADAFLNFLEDKLWTELRSRYPVDEKQRGLAGHSLGSLLGLHALFQPKPFFHRFLLSSPSVWYDSQSIWRLARRLRDNQEDLPARVFLSIGDEDTPSMTGDFKLLEGQLAARPFGGLDLTVRHFPGLDHYNVLPSAFTEGLQTLYPGQLNSNCS
jgi:predicted alpha/beta superfamily hydrolase